MPGTWSGFRHKTDVELLSLMDPFAHHWLVSEIVGLQPVEFWQFNSRRMSILQSDLILSRGPSRRAMEWSNYGIWVGAFRRITHATGLNFAWTWQRMSRSPDWPRSIPEC